MTTNYKTVRLFSKLKKRVGNYFFQKELLNNKSIRKRRIINFTDAKNIGVLYSFSDEEEYKIVNEYIKKWQDENKKVQSIGFFNSKRIPHYFIQKLSCDLITKANYNWYGKPTSKFVEPFISEPFDILVDFSLKNNFTLQYISGLSQSGFKIGSFDSGNSNYYDLMFKNNETTDLRDYIQQILYYLNSLNN